MVIKIDKCLIAPKILRSEAVAFRYHVATAASAPAAIRVAGLQAAATNRSWFQAFKTSALHF